MAELSGLEVLALLKEINSALRGAYINNIYSLGSSQLLRLRKHDAPDAWLVLSPKKGVWISSSVSERAETTGFTSKLRGELERSRFDGATQVDLDRVFQLAFEGAARRKLVVELMPPGNVIVMDEEGVVVLALDEVRSKSRRVVRGEKYAPPRQSRLSPTEVGAEDVRSMWAQERTAGTALGRHVGLPRKYVSESLARLGLTDESPSSSLRGREEEAVEVLRGLVNEARDNPRPCICMLPGGEDLFVVPPKGAEIVAEAGSMSELCDRLFLAEAGTGEGPPSPGQAKKKELEITISNLSAESDSLRAQAANVRTVAASASSMSIEDGLGALRDHGVRTARQPRSPSAISSLLFDRAKELESRSEESRAAAERLKKKLAKVASVGPEQRKTLSRKKAEWYEKFRWFFTSGGRLAVGGRDAQTNSALIGRHTDDADVVYHADLFGSPFFVLKGGKQQSEGEIRELAQATVAFSSAWKTGLGSADAYWVSPEQIARAAPSGEYLPRGSFAVRGRKNSVTKCVVEAAVGVDPSGRVMAGPEDAIGRHCAGYLVLRPQREKSSDTAKRALKELVSLSPGTAETLSLDDVLRALPSGGGKVVRRGGHPARDEP